MDNYVTKIFLILLAILIGTVSFAGDNNSVKSSMNTMLNKANTKIESVSP